MMWVRSLLFNASFYVWTALVATAGLPLLVSPLLVRVGQRLWAVGVVVLLRVFVGVRHEIRGREHLPDGPFIVAAKHQSAWETIIFFLLLDRPAYILKKELLSIPLYGWYALRGGHIAIDRKGGAKALRQLVLDTRAAAALGKVPVIFPQGTRTAPGADVPYQAGIAALYRGMNLPVVPAALNSGLFWGRNAFMKTPGTIVLEFLPPIPPGLEKGAFMTELESRTEAASDRLLEEGRR
ncbi:lysophospholipid acyltransferase family protein [Oceanibaculum pacificum]|uniref:Acyl-phosphate glycerol 3-phosphate acyltransferase n=1 Tax=Oceanibaculum pacificum TaxID=580166 RepID=A0A154WGX1_9PROT|nr:lysophospholipid acyltransferase family protein [Oceanibaculum pacificum]KZD12719.1 acyl-phosphate glycerol 3-phosphate acyltransferase [Oceanibaculum pacificum]